MIKKVVSPRRQPTARGGEDEIGRAAARLPAKEKATALNRRTLGGDSRSPGQPLPSKPGRFESDYLHHSSSGAGHRVNGDRPLDQPLGG